ncbi:MAG: hypothetical protein LBU71_01510, partial [Acinetobacter pittii]|nr:hypothetical protein [Acinetobacter pittii]
LDLEVKTQQDTDELKSPNQK